MSSWSWRRRELAEEAFAVLGPRAQALSAEQIKLAEFRQGFGIIVVAIRRAQGPMECNSSTNARLHAGNRLVLPGSTDTRRQFDVVTRPAGPAGAWA